MRPQFLTLPLLLTLAASAQAQRTNPPQRIFPTPSVQSDPLVTPTPASDTCPTSLVASRRGSPVTIWTISQQDASDPAFSLQLDRHSAGSGLHVHLEPSRFIQIPHTILRADLAVDYLAPGARVIPVATPSDRPTLSKTFVVHSGNLPSYKLDADLLIGQTAGIVRVHLVSIEFANGESWTAPTATACSTTPSLYVPISN